MDFARSRTFATFALPRGYRSVPGDPCPPRWLPGGLRHLPNRVFLFAPFAERLDHFQDISAGAGIFQSLQSGDARLSVSPEKTADARVQVAKFYGNRPVRCVPCLE